MIGSVSPFLLSQILAAGAFVLNGGEPHPGASLFLVCPDLHRAPREARGSAFAFAFWSAKARNRLRRRVSSGAAPASPRPAASANRGARSKGSRTTARSARSA